MAVDADTKKYLEEVKKGKPRRFVMICKGVKIVSMIVFKKGTVEKYKKQAKEEGKGQFYHGVVSGKGLDITFNLLRTDGFDKPPGKELILKDFLKTEADLKFNPTYAIVDELPSVSFDEDELNDPLIARFMKMEAVINKACDTHPESIPEIETRVNMIRGLLQDDETRASAGPKMDEFVQYLKDLLGGHAVIPAAPPLPTDGAAPSSPGGASGSDAPTPPSDAAAAGAAKLAEALKALKPLMDKLTNADPNRKGELQATLVQIAGEIKTRQLDQAKQNIMDFATLLKSLTSQQPVASPGESVDRAMEFAERRSALEPRLLEAQRADREKATKLGAVWDYAIGQAQAGNLENAFTAMDKLQAAIDLTLKSAQTGPAKGPTLSDSGEKFVEMWGDAAVRWRDTSEEVDTQISQLQQALKQTDDEELHEIAEFGLNGITGGAKVKLMATIQDVSSAGAAVSPALIGKTREAVAQFRNQIAGDERVDACDTNPFGVTVRIRDTFTPALAGLEAALNSMKSNA